jgi:hypothetical protein
MTKINLFILLPFLYFTKISAQEAKTVIINDTLTVNATLLYSDDFSYNLSNWISQFEKPESTIEIKDGMMEIDTKRGCTVWFTKKLNSPLIIEYDAVMIDNGGKNDRVSDLNCFWMASDPNNKEDSAEKIFRLNGSLGNYNYLKLYYVGFGGRNNTTTRFRRYPGDGSRPMLPEHDLSAPQYLLTGNTVNHIKIINYHGIVQYYRNNQLVFDFYDTEPLSSGYYGLRTTINHMTFDNFRVYSIVPIKHK